MVTALVCIWCGLVFLGVNLQAGHGDAALARWGWASERSIYAGEYWALITSAFVHQNILHLVFNLYWTWMLGGAFERALGPVATLAFIAGSAFVSSGLQMGLAGPGIGLSGVGYAFFGFGWISRGHYREFGFVDNRVVQTFVVWFFICVVATYAGFLSIGNVAHLAGLAFGAAVAGAIVRPRLRVWLCVGLVALTALSVVPLFWSPLSTVWVADKAFEASKQGNYARAIPLYKRSLALGADPKWVWQSLALAYYNLGDTMDYENALRELSRVDPEEASKLPPAR